MSAPTTGTSYHIESRVKSTSSDKQKYAHTKNSSSDDGAKLVISKDNDNSSYNFYLEAAENDGTYQWYYIQNAEDSSNHYCQQKEEKEKSIIQIQDKQDIDQQKWRLDYQESDSGNEQYWIINKSSGLAWKVEDGDTGDGSEIQLVTPRADNDGFLWEFLPHHT